MTLEWIRVRDELPPDGRAVETKVDDERGCRNVRLLQRRGRLCDLCFTADEGPGESMYVYYTPTHWRTIGGKHEGQV